MRLAKPRALSFAPFIKDLKKYKLNYFKGDLSSAFAVALMTIPQSIAYSLLAGLPPTAGLFSAIFGTIFTASFGSSRTLVSGPSTGTAILLQATLVEVLYTSFEQVPKSEIEGVSIAILMQIVFLVGLIQIGAAFFNVSKFLQFVGRPVILGYFGGITVAIGVIQAFAFTGIPSKLNDVPLIIRGWELLTSIPMIQWTTTLVGVLSITFLILIRHYLKNWPHALLMLVLGSFLAFCLNEWGIGPGVKVLGSLQVPENPFPRFTVPLFQLKTLSRIFPSAVAIALLGILEVFSISRTFSAKTGQKIEVNQDVLGLGVSNFLLSWIFPAMPCSGSATRTALNYRLHSKSRFSSVFSGIFMALILFFFWPFVKRIPLAALAALLIASVHTLMDWKEIKLVFRATKEDALVFSLTFASCLLFRLDIAFFIGIVISIVTYLNKSAAPHLVEYAFNPKGRLMIVNTKGKVHRKVRIIGIGGDLYFAAADVFQSTLMGVAEDPNVQAIVLRLNNVHHMDASMCLALLSLHDTLKESGRYLVISGITEEVWFVLYRSKLTREIGFDNLFFTDETNPQFSTWKGALRAHELIQNGSGE